MARKIKYPEVTPPSEITITDAGGYLIFRPARDGSDRRTEDLIQIDCFSWVNYHHPDLWFFHPVNEGMMPPQYREKLIQMGMRKGVNDLITQMPRSGFSGGTFELKRPQGVPSDVTKEQAEYLSAVRAAGGFSAACFGVDAFRRAVKYYLTGH